MSEKTEEQQKKTYTKMDTTATSRGYSPNTHITPMIYHITPFVDFYSDEGIISLSVKELQIGAYLLAFAHQKPQALLVEALETRMVEAQNIGGGYYAEGHTKDYNNKAGRAMRDIQVQSEEACKTEESGISISITSCLEGRTEKLQKACMRTN